MRTSCITICFLFLLLAGNACYAQDKSMSTAASKATTVADLAALNMYEISLLKLTEAKGRDAGLMNSIQGMVADHQRLDLQLTSYANRKTIDMDDAATSQFSSNNTKAFETQAPGAGLDADLVNELVNTHQQLITILDHMEHSGDAYLQDLSNQYMPRFKGHLDKLIPLRVKMHSANAQPASTPMTAELADKEDAKYLTDLAATNQYILMMMELALAKGSNRELKDAVQRMIEDHHHITDRANSLAKGKGYSLNTGDRKDYMEKMAKWAGRRGGMEWDADMVEELTDMHKDAIDSIEDAMTDVKDQEMKLLMTETLTVLNTHVTTFTAIKETVKKPWKKKR